MTRRRGQPASATASASTPFFDQFRASLARLPVGLIRVGAPATPEAVARAEHSLGRPLPSPYAAFLQSFDGADLFHETVVIAGVGPEAALDLLELNAVGGAPLAFATGAADERYALRDDGRVVRQDAGTDEQAVAGSSFAAWLDATVAATQVLYGPDGEYAPDVFDPSGEEVTPIIALRQAERAQKQDTGAAGWAHAEALALSRLGRTRAAVGAFERAASLDPDTPWIWFDLGRAALEAGSSARAADAFQKAAALEPGPGGAMLLAWAARAAQGPAAGTDARALAQAALHRDPGLVEALIRAIDSAAAADDPEAAAEATALLAAVDPGALPPPRVRLKILDDAKPATAKPAREKPASGASANAKSASAKPTERRLPKPPPARPPHPPRGERPQSGGRRPGR